MHFKDVDEIIFILFISGKRISDLQVDQETDTHFTEIY